MAELYGETESGGAYATSFPDSSGGTLYKIKETNGVETVLPKRAYYAQPGTYTYVVPFFAAGPHGAMSVSATWSADNCGVSLQAGSGTPVPTGACYQGDQDYLVSHNIMADFAAADSFNHHLSLTFTTTNEGGPTGLTGVFNITAQCP